MYRGETVLRGVMRHGSFGQYMAPLLGDSTGGFSFTESDQIYISAACKGLQYLPQQGSNSLSAVGTFHQSTVDWVVHIRPIGCGIPLIFCLGTFLMLARSTLSRAVAR
jgi:hypothetical protein